MWQSRRGFLSLAAVGAVFVGVGSAAWAQQGPIPRSDPDPLEGKDPFGVATPGGPILRPNPRAVMEANQKDINKDVERLSEIVRQLRKQLEEKDSKNVLSLDVLRDTDEIEKLAKHIRTLVRG